MENNGEIQEIAMTLIDKDIANVLSLAILGLSIAIMLAFAGIILYLWKSRNGNDTLQTLTKLLSKFADKVDKVDGLETSVDKQSDLMERLIISIETGDKTKIEQHNSFLQLVSEIGQDIKVTQQAVKEMKDDHGNILKQIAEALETLAKNGVKLSPQQQKDIIDSVSRQISEDVGNAITDNNSVLISAINEQIEKLTMVQSKDDTKAKADIEEEKGK